MKTGANSNSGLVVPIRVSTGRRSVSAGETASAATTVPPTALNCLAKALTSSSAYRLPSCIVATFVAWTLCAYFTAAPAPLMSL